MKENTFVTVIVPTYNHADYIEHALDSVLIQKTKFDYIIDICDDVSTDNTQGILKKYKEQFPEKIVLNIRKENLGATKNIHESLCRVRTKYFIILEGDDYWCDENKLQMQVDFMEKNNQYTMCTHDTYFKDELRNTEIIAPNAPNMTYFTIENAPYTHSTSRLYKNIVDFTKEDPSFIPYEIVMYYKFLSLGDIGYINKAMSVYRISGKGIWSSLTEEQKNNDNAVFFLKIDIYLQRKYTHIFQKHYLPATPEPRKRKRSLLYRIVRKIYRIAKILLKIN